MSSLDKLKNSIAVTIADALGKYHTGFFSKRVLKTKEQVEANTNEKNLVSAVVVGELINNMVSDIYVGNDGKLHKVKGGADAEIPFKKATTKYVQIYASAVGTYDGNGGIATGLTLKVNGVTVFSQTKTGQGQSVDTTYTHTVQP